MIRRDAAIVAVDAKRLQLTLDRPWGGCRAAGCGTRQLSDRSVVELPRELIQPALPARILSGATLQIAIEPRRLVSLSLAVFLLPILLMLLSCVTCGAFVSHSSGAMSLAALLGLLVGSRLAASSVKRIIAGEDRALLTIAETSDEAR